MSEHEEVVLNNLRALFEKATAHHHDDGIGQYMTPGDLKKLCKQFDIGPSESDIIFANLDRNSDGLLSVEEFLVGFRTLNKNQNNCSTLNNVNNVSNANNDQNYSSTFDHTNHDDEKDEAEKNKISNSEDNLLDKTTTTTTNQLVGQISLISFDEEEEAQENVDNESKCKCSAQIATHVIPTNAQNKSSSIIDQVQQSYSNNNKNNQSEQRNQQLIGSGIKSVAVRRSNSLVSAQILGRRTLSSEHDINNQQNDVPPRVFEMSKKAKPGELQIVTANDPEEQNEQKHVEQEDSVDSSQDSGFDLLTGIEDFEVGPLSQLQQPNKRQMRKLLLDLVQNIQLLQSENKKLIKIWSSREENFPELELRTKNMESKTDNLHNYIRELVEINHEMFHDPIKPTTSSTSTSTSNQKQKNSRNLKLKDANQLHESNDSLRETIRKLQNNLHSVLAEQNRLRDEYSDRVKHLEFELKAKQRRNSRAEEELEFLKKTSQSLENSRRVMEIRKLFDSYLESSKSSLYDTNSQNVEQRAKNIWEHKREMWFKKRDSFQSDSNLQNILDRGLTTNLKGRKLSSRSNCWQPRDEKIMEETPSSWKDGIQKLEAIKSSSNDSLNDSDDNRVIQRKNCSVRRRVSFSNPEILEQNLEKIKKSFRSKEMDNSFEENENNQESEALPSPKNVRMSVNIFKIIFIGDSMVGKTSFIHRATRGFFTDRCSSTIGIDFKRRLIKIKDTIHELQLWDTAGQERFRSITMNYFRKVDAICLMYDVTRERTFTNVRFWVNSIQNSVSTGNLPILILGNKIDCRNETTDGKSVKSCVSTQDGEKMATNLQMGPFCRFMETSGKSGHNVEEALAELTKMMIWTSLIGKDAKQIEREEREKAIKLQENAKMQNKSKSKCCKS